MKVLNRNFLELPKNVIGIVCMGCSGEVEEWANGIAGMLDDERIVDDGSDVFMEVGKIEGNVAGEEGRSDYYFVFSEKCMELINMGKLAMWRIKFGECSWIEDFVVNYAGDYNASPNPVNMPPMFPHVKVSLDLEGPDGNALAIIGAVKTALRRAGVSTEDQNKYQDEAMSGDHDNVLATAAKWVCFNV